MIQIHHSLRKFSYVEFSVGCTFNTKCSGVSFLCDMVYNTMVHYDNDML